MNQTQPYMDMHASHLSSAQPYASQSATAGSMGHYSYPQPSVMQSQSAYGPPGGSYYGYNGVTSPQGTHSVSAPLGSQMPSQMLPLPAMATAPAPHPYSSAPPQGYGNAPFDPTGQSAPSNGKAKVTATLWEDEGTLCFQIEAEGVCVARREDNHMINGTKLLNVAKMTRGRRDGILKSEKVRHVVKIGPMHLKGVWIPFERALEMANKEKITDKLYPLFAHNIQAMSQRRVDTPMGRPPSGGPSSVVHHHSMSGSLPPHQRPNLDRTQTFPTPPATASNLIGMGAQPAAYDWSNNVPAANPLSVDTTLNNNRSMPTTPAATPPGTGMQSMSQYPSQNGYDSKSFYTAAPSAQPHYATHPSMTPQSMTSKSETYSHPNASGDVSHTSAEGDQDHGHDNGYLHETTNGYSQPRNTYTYSTAPNVSSIGEHAHLSPEMSGSSPHQNASGRVTPRTTGGAPGNQWTSSYHTPPRTGGNGVYGTLSDTRSSLSNGDHYSAPTYGSMNGNGKRSRDDDDEPSRPDSRGPDASFDLKRRKTLNDSSIGGPVGGPPIALQSIKAGGMSRGRR